MRNCGNRASQMDTGRGEENAPARRRIRQYEMTGTTTWKQNTITDERALARFFDSQVIFQVQTKLHIHRSWQIPAKTSRVIENQLQPGHAEPWQTRAFPHIFRRRHHYFPRNETENAHDTERRKGQGRHHHSGQVRMVLKRVADFFIGWNNGECSNHACGVLIAIREVWRSCSCSGDRSPQRQCAWL